MAEVPVIIKAFDSVNAPIESIPHIASDNPTLTGISVEFSPNCAAAAAETLPLVEVPDFITGSTAASQPINSNTSGIAALVSTLQSPLDDQGSEIADPVNLKPM